MVDINNALTTANQQGVVSDDALAVYQLADLGNTIQDNLGCVPSDIDSSEVFGFFGIIDDSTSIRMAGNTHAVQDGYNRILNALKDCQNRDEILVMTSLLNQGILHPPCPLVDAPEFLNFNPAGGTPLFDRTIEACKLGMAKWKEFSDDGSDFRGLIFLLSDGADMGSSSAVGQANSVVTDLLEKELFTFIAMGVKDRSGTDFKKVYGDMGIPKEWILEVSDDEHSIRQACGVVSRAAETASQTGGLSQHSGIQAFDD